MKLNDIYPSAWLKASDLGDTPLVLTIDRIEMAEMQDGNRKPALYFQEEDKGLILNKTNANAIAAVYGDDTDDWLQQKIQLISVPTDFQGRTVDAIRVRVRQAKPAAKPQLSGDRTVRSGTASYGEAKGRAQGRPMESGNRPEIDDDLNDPLPF
jgi:hypothetical protein